MSQSQATRPIDLAVIVGSLRAGSFNRMLANALIGLAPAGVSGRIVEIRDLPLYDPDLETAAPDAWTRFRAAIAPADAVLFVTPEYNRSVPAGVKNAIDVGSRPYGKSVWSGKPAAIVSSSPGAISGFGANHHLRQSLVFLDMPTLQQPEAYIAHVDKLLGQDGAITNDATRTFLGNVMTAFATFIDRNRRG